MSRGKVKYLRRPRLPYPRVAGLYRHTPTKTLVHVQNGFKNHTVWYCDNPDCTHHTRIIIRVLKVKDDEKGWLDAKEAAWLTSQHKWCPFHWAQIHRDGGRDHKRGEWEQIVRQKDSYTKLLRDYQRKRVYNAESHFLSTYSRAHGDDTRLSLDKGKDYLRYLAGQMGAKCPGLELNERLNGGYAGIGGIHLEPAANNPFFLRHEFAHILDPSMGRQKTRREGFHGPSFCHQLLLLTTAALGPMGGYMLQESFDKYKVDYDPDPRDG